MPRQLFYSAVLLLCVLSMCGSGSGAAEEAERKSKNSIFCWKEIKAEAVERRVSLRAPVLLNVGNELFFIAEAHHKSGAGVDVVTGIVSHSLTVTAGVAEEALGGAGQWKAQNLCNCSTEERMAHVNQPTAVVSGSDIYMLLGNYSSLPSEATEPAWRILLVKGSLTTAESAKKTVEWGDTYLLSRISPLEKHKSLSRLTGGGGIGCCGEGKYACLPGAGHKEGGEEGGGYLSRKDRLADHALQ
ncbi:trans-sialidase [Trypanosoma rangeli]|uniref:Trans-sialidase n=1 Tax=Trypanosoma rangeli TaxID=5698 RepID=A0A422MTG7_TRYRA|nr:trans-sialidase [Trypanosoma rangeli]RNE96491.1 trans-sialidase [Trypanosoma rangeli]|eukprot:RNE96491.1 trans-sialidase [Trypanosoma rangeli]